MARDINLRIEGARGHPDDITRERGKEKKRWFRNPDDHNRQERELSS